SRCTRTITTLPPMVAKKAELPLIARDRTDARITMSTASNAVLRASERLCPIRIMARVARKTMIPRSEIWRKVKSFGCEPSLGHCEQGKRRRQKERQRPRQEREQSELSQRRQKGWPEKEALNALSLPRCSCHRLWRQKSGF